MKTTVCLNIYYTVYALYTGYHPMQISCDLESINLNFAHVFKLNSLINTYVAKKKRKRKKSRVSSVLANGSILIHSSHTETVLFVVYQVTAGRTDKGFSKKSSVYECGQASWLN